MKNFDFTYDEVMTALRDANLNKVDGFTTAELANTMGWSSNWANNRIRKMINNGTAEYVGMKNAIKVDGMQCKKPAYRLIG